MSMRRLPDERDNDVTARAMADPRIARDSSRYTLFVDGERVRPRAIRYGGEDVRSGDAHAMLLTATLPGSWPDTIEGKPVTATLHVSDPDDENGREAEWIEFDGNIKDFDRTDDGDTTIDAYTPGERLGRQKTGQRVAWSGHTPKSAMLWAVGQAGYRRVDLRLVPNYPKLYREGEDEFGEDAARAELLADIYAQSQAVFFDDPDKRGRGLPSSALRVPTTTAPDFSYVVGREIRKNAFKVSPANSDGRYHSVVVAYEDPAGQRVVLKKIPVDNGGVFVPEFVDFEVAATDASPAALEDALKVGAEAARGFSYGAFGFEVTTLVLDPRIVRGTHGVIEETDLEGRELVTRRWMVVVGGYGRDPKSYEPTMTGAALKVREVRRPYVEQERTTDRLLYQVPPSPTMGVDWRGRFYISSRASWARYDAERGSLIVDAVAAREAGVYVVKVGDRLRFYDGVEPDPGVGTMRLEDMKLQDIENRTLDEISHLTPEGVYA